MKAMRKLIVFGLLLSSIISYSQQSEITVLTVGESELVNIENNKTLVDACASWRLTKKDVYDFFLNSKQISSFEKNNYYYHMPCEISGTLNRNDTIFDYFINAGSTARLVYGENMYLYGCSDTICNKLVLMPPDRADL